MSSGLPTVCVLGLGYIGLPTASLLAARGFQVLGVDVDAALVRSLSSADLHFREPELDVLVRSAVHSGNLRVAVEPAPADVFILAVPTPLGAGRQPDLRFVERATRAAAVALKAGDLVILESTSPVGTTEQVCAWLCEARPDLVEGGGARFCVAHCPERVLPGRILRELVENDRVVGGVDEASTTAAVRFYEGFVSGAVHGTTARTAELCKLAENAYRDANIAFANELSMVCDRLGVDVWELRALANRHPRVDVLRPGPGVGGHCVAVDPWFLISACPDDAVLMRASREVNEGKLRWVVARVLERAQRFASPVIGCLGLTYKPDVDDVRESPALAVAVALREAGVGEVVATDPNLDAASFGLVPLDELLARADVIVALVAHREFADIERKRLEDRVLIDVAGVFR